MNILHSSKSCEWHTPDWVIDLVRKVLPNIALDPASCPEANERVMAERFYTEKDNGLSKSWTTPGSIFCNPPSGRVGKHSLPFLFWQKLMQSHFRDAIFLAFSIEQLQTTQGKGVKSIGEFPICIPKKRIKFINSSGKFNSPTHGNIICYVSGDIDSSSAFKEVFKDVGVILN